MSGGGEKIKGGYYLKARCIQDSEIAHAPPHCREIWDWLIKEANHKDRKTHGRIIRRGQLLITYSDILDGLHWKVGWRVERYTKWQCEAAMKLLRKLGMVTTQKTTAGMVITILNYDKYQDFRNYESHKENHDESRNSPQSSHTIHNTLNTLKSINTEITDSEPPVREESAGPSPKPKNPIPLCPQKNIIELYHEILPELPVIQVWDSTSESWLRARWSEDPERQNLEFWKKYFSWVRKSKFLMGGKNGFRADLHWLVRSSNFAKVVNGRYHNNQTFHDRLKEIGQEWLADQMKKDTCGF